MSTDAAQIAERIARRAAAAPVRIAAAESLTSGAIASALGAAPQASQWFAGSIVAYASDVKHNLLGVGAGPVVCRSAAEEMALGARRLLAADIAVAVTGAGGPDPQDDQAPGTVFIAVVTTAGSRVVERHFDGDPAQVVHDTVREALTLVEGSLP